MSLKCTYVNRIDTQEKRFENKRKLIDALTACGKYNMLYLYICILSMDGVESRTERKWKCL